MRFTTALGIEVLVTLLNSVVFNRCNKSALAYANILHRVGYRVSIRVERVPGDNKYLFQLKVLQDRDRTRTCKQKGVHQKSDKLRIFS